MNMGPWSISDMWRKDRCPQTVVDLFATVIKKAFDRAYEDMFNHGMGLVKLEDDGDAAYQDEMRRG